MLRRKIVIAAGAERSPNTGFENSRIDMNIARRNTYVGNRRAQRWNPG